MAKRAAQVTSRLIRRSPLPEGESDQDEHRGFPRAELAVPFALTIGEGAARTFSATLRSRNLSVSGAFLESTFFLPVGTELRVSFEVDAEEDPVLARAEAAFIRVGARRGIWDSIFGVLRTDRSDVGQVVSWPEAPGVCAKLPAV